MSFGNHFLHFLFVLIILSTLFLYIFHHWKPRIEICEFLMQFYIIGVGVHLFSTRKQYLLEYDALKTISKLKNTQVIKNLSDIWTIRLDKCVSFLNSNYWNDSQIHSADYNWPGKFWKTQILVTRHFLHVLFQHFHLIIVNSIQICLFFQSTCICICHFSIEVNEVCRPTNK